MATASRTAATDLRTRRRSPSLRTLAGSRGSSIIRAASAPRSFNLDSSPSHSAIGGLLLGNGEQGRQGGDAAPGVPGQPNPGYGRDTGVDPWGATRSSRDFGPHAGIPVIQTEPTRLSLPEVDVMIQRTIGVSPGQTRIVQHATGAEFAAAYAAHLGPEWVVQSTVRLHVPGTNRSYDLDGVPAVYFPGRREIHLRPMAGNTTRVHEVLHRASDHSAVRIFGHGWSEGMTELLAQEITGPRPTTGYGENIRVVEALFATVGRQTVVNAYAGRGVNELRTALVGALGPTQAQRFWREFKAEPTAVTPERAAALINLLRPATP